MMQRSGHFDKFFKNAAINYCNWDFVPGFSQRVFGVIQGRVLYIICYLLQQSETAESAWGQDFLEKAGLIFDYHFFLQNSQLISAEIAIRQEKGTENMSKTTV